jgi:glycosyltransferase involved in cell wall biosynthesis
MNILMVSDVYFPRVNGVSTSIKTFRTSLQQQGHNVVLVAPDYQQDIGDDPDIIRIPSRYLWLDPEDRMMKYGAIMALTDELRSRNFDLLHIQTPFVAHRAGLQLAQRLDIPVVETYHTYFEEYLYHYVPFLPRRLMKAAARHFTRAQCNRLDAVVVPSRAMRDVLVEYGVTVPHSIIPTGLELDSFVNGSGNRFRQAHGIDPGRPVLVHVGRVAHEKNIDFLIDVLSSLRGRFEEILLVIAGEGPARKSLRTRVARDKLEANVMFVDYLPRGEQLWDCFCAGNAFVFASSTETQGLVLLEAMALGTPVVSTAVMGTRDILAAGKGCLVAELDVADFTRKLTRLLDDSELQTKLGQDGKQYVHEWSADAMAERMAGFYDSLLSADASASRERRTEPAASR